MLKYNMFYLVHLESVAQCMAYIFAKCPLRVLLVLICILATGSTELAT